MKNNIKYTILLIAAMFALNAAAQNRAEWILSFDTLELNPVSLNGTTFYEIYMGEDFSKSASLGQANLPHYNKLIQIPEGKQIQIKHTVLEKDTVTIKENILIAPLQKSRLKQDNNQDFYFDQQYYNTDTFTGSNEVTVKHFGQMGKNNTAVISIAPLRYNPHKNMIERIKKIKTEIIFTPQSKSMGASAGEVHDQHPFKMVVLADDMFKQTLVPFIQWKTMQGFDITEVYTSQTGKNAEEIRSYLKDMYYAATQTSPAFDYLLIVGDTEQIPAFVGEYTIDNYPAHYTDLYYAEYTDDILPDVFYGRMSANDTSTLQNIIDKTLKYEKFLFDNNAFLNNSLLVAGRELGDNAPAFTNGQMNYTKQYLHPYTDTSVFYNPSSALPENRTAIRNRLNEGNSWVNYTGHCNYNGWQNPPYNIKDVDTALNNTERYGIFINNCCLSGKFDEKSCFTESLLSAKDKGAVAAIGASDYTLWDEDYYWSVGSKAVKETPEYNHERMGMYDRFFHTYNQPYNERYVTAGQIIQAGNLAVMQSLSSYSDHYWEMYNLQGDPTLIPYAGIPQDFTVSLPDSIVLGQTNIEITTEPYTYIALSSGNKLIDARQADSSGKVSLDISNISAPQTVNIVFTNQFFKPLIDSFRVVAPDNYFIAMKDITVRQKDKTESEENLTVSGTYSVDCKIINSGKRNFKSKGCYVKLISDKNLLISEDNLLISDIISGDSLSVTGAFAFTVADGVKNLSVSELHFQIYQDGEIINDQKVLKDIFAPELLISSTAMQSSNDTVYITAELMNTGRWPIQSGEVTLYDLSGGFSITDSVKEVKALDKGESEHITFGIGKTFGSTDTLSFAVNYVAGKYSAMQHYDIPLTAQCEGFEDGFSVFSWQNDADNPWCTDSVIYYSGNRSARSKHNLADNTKSRLTLTIDNTVSSQFSFFAKISSERDYDGLRFLIDGKTMLYLSGTEDGLGIELDWKKYSFDIGSGQHTLCFSYEKDQSAAYGYDCAWIDEVTLACGSDSLVFALDELYADNTVIFPNPARDMVYFNNLPDKSAVTVFDNTGKLKYYNTCVSANSGMDVSSFENGIYYVVITSQDNKQLKRKLIILK